MGEVKVLGAWGSPFSRRVEMALKLKGVEYEYMEEDLINKSPLLLKHNPVHKKLPVLLHNANPIAESLVILEYIDETWEGPPILPKDPYQRSKARFWAKFVDDEVLPAMWKACWSRGEERERAKEEAVELLKFLDSEIKGKKLFGGDNIGVVDIAANFIGYWFGVIAEVVGVVEEVISKEKHPNLCRWIEEYNKCSFVKENVPPKDQLARKFKDGIPAATATAAK
ncbi:UNVERIFIED_CONTAM: putative glutathione S-transferase [Sesamum radiatum]|uniref:Probable glutathione S-transferase n=1 Tax=Sesamum radiatum TaxID=300843 RepID=A0AAW2NL04_SESRA